jgi:hypothetical protein
MTQEVKDNEKGNICQGGHALLWALSFALIVVMAAWLAVSCGNERKA